MEENPLDYAAWVEARDGPGVIAVLREKRDSRVKVSKIEEKEIAKHYRGELKKIESARLEGKTGYIAFISWQ